VHESPGVMRSGGTVFVNPGPAYQDRCALITISENCDIEARSISG
jgi:Icc-related predicted phosphoesterase